MSASKRQSFWKSLFAATLTVGSSALPALAQDSVETTGRTTVWLPERVFDGAASIDTMFNVILWLTCAVCAAVFVVLVTFLVKYRYQPGRRPTFVHGHNAMEAAWTLIPTIILAVIAVLSQDTWSQIKQQPAREGGEIDVRVVGMQFKWYFQYPGADGKFGPRRPELVHPDAQDIDEKIGLDRNDPDGKDDLVLDKMVVPVRRRVLLDLTSVDVIHSFFLPNFRIKQDAVPGLTTRMWFEANRTSAEVIGRGQFEPLTTNDPETYQTILIADSKPFDIACAELCGSGHYTMRGKLYVVSEEQYADYMKHEWALAAPADQANQGY